MKHIAVTGINFAKNVFQIYGTDPSGFAVLKKEGSRRQMIKQPEIFIRKYY
jgi:hypothetical protein